MGYRMAGMQPDVKMIIGMILIFTGLILAFYGLVPLRSRKIIDNETRVRIRVLDDTPLSKKHIIMLLVISIAVIIDVMKPAALSFVAPGMANEYGLKSAATPHGHIPVAMLPLFGISGTVLGSWLWGWLGDRIGRRSSILFAGLLFVTTSICGAMPGFNWNLLMCFLMGIGAGGMLPITFTLIAETIPARHRGWIIVLVGGFVAGAGYVLTSWLAGALTPQYSWRILWLIGLPTGIILLALNYWIPESPRFLLAHGRQEEAEDIMTQFGAIAISDDLDQDHRDEAKEPTPRNLNSIWFIASNLAICILALGVGLITYGFQLWMPTNLQHLGYTAVNSDYLVRNAALIGLPISLAATIMYGFWSSKKTIIFFFGLLGIALLGFVIIGNSLAHDHALLIALLAVPLSGVSLVAALVTVYASEVYPTRMRSRGTGLIAGVTKAGGVAIIAAVVTASNTPSIALTAMAGIVPVALGILIFSIVGRETKNRRLEEIGGVTFPYELDDLRPAR